MLLGETYLFKLDKWLALRKKIPQATQPRLTLNEYLKKHREYLKKWKEGKQLRVHKDTNCLTIAAFATADRYDLESVLNALKNQDRYTACELTNDVPMETVLCNAVHLKSSALNGEEDSHVFCFDVGTVVMWNLTHGQREEMLKFLNRFEKRPYGYNLSRSSSELLAYKYAGCKASFLYDNTLYFGVAEKDSDMIGLNRFLLSSAISLSTKMAALEGMVETHLSSMETTAERLKAGKELKMKQKQVLAIAGVTYATKHNLKLSTDSLLLPCKLLEHFKSNNERESFANTCLYFSLPQRVELFDNNMALCECYINLLLNHFSYRQSLRSQNIILTLLGIGGVVIVLNMIKKYS